MLGNVGDRVAHGGPIVAVLGAVDNVLMFFIAVIIGSLVTAIMANALKKNVDNQEQPATYPSEAPDEPLTPEPERQEASGQTNKEEELHINKLTDITSLDLIDIQLAGTSRDEVIDEMIGKLDREGILTSREDFRKAILDREAESTTGIGMNIAIPHGKSNSVKKPAVVFGIKQDGVDWKSFDQTDAKLIFMIAVPKESVGDAHLKILQMLSRKLMDDSFREQLLAAKTKEEAYSLLETIE
jgi:PTS system fructose-specific IIC component